MSMRFNRFYNKLSKKNNKINLASYDDKLISSVPAEELDLPNGYTISDNKVFYNDTEIGKFSYRNVDEMGSIDLDSINIVDNEPVLDLDGINIPEEDNEPVLDLDGINIPEEDNEPVLDLDGINIVPSKATNVPKTTIDDTELVNEGHVFPSYEIKEEFTTQEQQELLEKIHDVQEALRKSFLEYESNKKDLSEDYVKQIEGYKTRFNDMQEEITFESKSKTEAQLDELIRMKKQVDNSNNRVNMNKDVQKTQEPSKETTSALDRIRSAKKEDKEQEEKRIELIKEYADLFHDNEILCVVCTKLRDYLVETGENIEFNSLVRYYHVLPDLSNSIYSVEDIESMIKDAKYHKERLHDMVVNAKAKQEAEKSKKTENEEVKAKKALIAKSLVNDMKDIIARDAKIKGMNALTFTLKQVAEIKKAKEEKSKKIKNALAKLKERDETRKAEAEARRIKEARDQKEANEILSKIKGLLDQGQEIMDKARMNDIAFPYYVKYEKEGSTSVRSDIQFVYEERKYKYYKDAFAANVSSVTIEGLRNFYDEVLKHFNSFKSYIDDAMKLKNTTSKVIDEIKDNNQDSKIVIPNFLRLPNEEDLADKRRKDIEDSEKAVEKARLARENARLEKERKEQEEKEQARILAQAKKEAEKQEIINSIKNDSDVDFETLDERIYNKYSIKDLKELDEKYTEKIEKFNSKLDKTNSKIEKTDKKLLEKEVALTLAIESSNTENELLYRSEILELKEKLEELKDKAETLKAKISDKEATISSIKERFTAESIKVYEENEAEELRIMQEKEDAMNARLEEEAILERDKNRKEISKVFRQDVAKEESALNFKTNNEIKKLLAYTKQLEAEGKDSKEFIKNYAAAIEAERKANDKLKELELAMGIVKDNKKTAKRK